MLNDNHWKWFTWGKHPALDDFVWAGTQTALFKRFAKWVDNGFAKMKDDPDFRSRNCSWRFWTKGTGKDVVCGLVRNSCDVHGRNFPLLSIGIGELDGWQINSPMLPFAFGPIWNNLEYIASARFDTVSQLNESLQLIERPVPDWRHYLRRISDTADPSNPTICDETAEDGKLLLKINCRQPEKLPHDPRFCKSVTPVDNSPLVVFIGEVQNDITVAVIRNALTPDDFVWLWNLNQENRQTARPLKLEE